MQPEYSTLWRTSNAWERVAAGARPRLQHQEAVTLLPGERQAINRHVLALGDRMRLIGLADEFFFTIKESCKFGQGHDWNRQRQWLTALFARFFAAECHVGWVSLTSERRPSHARKLQDRRVKVLDDPGSIPPTPLFAATDLGRGRPLRLFPGGHELCIPTEGLHLHDGGEKARSRSGQVFLIHSPRTVDARDFGIHHSYCEFWACLALPGRDEGDRERLALRQIPAVPRDQYRAGPDRLRVNPILSLFKVDLRLGKSTYFGFQIDRASGGVLDLRTTRAPLDATIVMASLVERTAIARALLDTNRPTMGAGVAPVPAPAIPDLPTVPRLRFHTRPEHPLEPVPEPGSDGELPLSEASSVQFLSTVGAWVQNAWNRLGTSLSPTQTRPQPRGLLEVYAALPFRGCVLPIGVPDALEREIEPTLAAVTQEVYGERELVRETKGGACRIRIIFYRAQSAFETDPRYADALNKLEAALRQTGHKRDEVLNRLRFFWAVVETKSFSRASQRLYPGDLTRAHQVKNGVLKLTTFLAIGTLCSVNPKGAFEKLTAAGHALHEYLMQRIDLRQTLSGPGPTRGKRG